MSGSQRLSACPSCRRKILASFGLTPHRRYSRPSIAPKISIDIKHIRRAPGLYEQNCVDRRYESLRKNSWRIIELHETAQRAIQEARPLREAINRIHKLLPKSEDKESLLKEARALQPRLAEYEKIQKDCEHESQELAESMPNLTSTQTPVGDQPELISYLNEALPKKLGTPSHVEIGAKLDLLDFEGSAAASGWGWYFLKNEAALLEQALVQYALSVARRRGWQVVAPPSMVYEHIAAACGFQPRDKNEEQQIYAIQQAEKDREKPRMIIAGTAEIPLAGMKANTTFEQTHLPLKVIGASRCYRAEAGARGVDTKGLYRVHEFTKVEMFGWTLPDMSPKASLDSEDMFESAGLTQHSRQLFTEMIDIQMEILTALELPCRVLEMPTHDLGASASRKRDIEAWFPSRTRGENGATASESGWGELTSASICTDYQTRRLATRVKLQQSGRLEFPHTVNGTAMAVPRVLACIMENHYDEARGAVRIPRALQPGMGGLKEIRKA